MAVSFEMLLINVVAFVAIFSALMVVFHRSPMVSVVFLIVNLVCVAPFFLALSDGTGFASTVALGTMAGTVSQAAFCVTY
ncbi:MAG: hypothetical protein L0170_05790, partial [Acidobacteria bacterium]|nr:hypothetical protein [Acidobacteriota bacterium]